MIDKILKRKPDAKKETTPVKAGAKRKAAARSTSGKKTPTQARKTAATAKKKAAVTKRKSTTTKKTVARKKAAPKKKAASKPAVRKTAAKKKAPATRKPATRKPATRKTATSKTATKSSAVKKQTPQSSLGGGLLPDFAVMKGFFKKMHKSQVHHEHAQEQIIADFSSRMEQTFNHFHAEFDERERVLEKKLKYSEKDQEREIRRVKWMSVPTGLLAIAGLVYIFYVVHIMERSMTSMSADMQQISGNISTMSEDTRSMTTNIAYMSNSMGNMDHRMANMDRNMGQLSHSMVPIGKAAHKAEPMMSAMRTFMPF